MIHLVSGPTVDREGQDLLVRMRPPPKLREPHDSIVAVRDVGVLQLGRMRGEEQLERAEIPRSPNLLRWEALAVKAVGHDRSCSL